MLTSSPFPPSLHRLSIMQGLRASMARTPGKPALAGAHGTLVYRDLFDAGARRRAALPATASGVLQWLDSAAGMAPDDEDSPVPSMPAGCNQRTVVMRLLDLAVAHPVFSRDTVSAVPIPASMPDAVEAWLAPLWLGGTVHGFEAGDLDGVVAAILDGSVNQAWLGPAEFERLRTLPGTPPPSFRGVLCAGMPPPGAARALREWLGAERISAQCRGADGVPARHPGLAAAGEAYPGASALAGGLA